MSCEKFWEDSSYANKKVLRLKDFKKIVEDFSILEKKYKELEEFLSLDTEDIEYLSQINKEFDKFWQDILQLELKALLSEELDRNSAILSINSGAGGTEACDWAEMLLRMYLRWAESRGYKVRITDILSGEEAGIKNVTVLVEGEYAYGYLKAEAGVHRLVRISPFDANRRRHTSFASVGVTALVSEDIEIKIRPEELKIDVYRSRGHGGQSVNTTDSAVRITHLPTGIIVQCQNERSQYQNKQVALNILRARLYQKMKEEKEEKLSKEYAEKRKIEWGSQIRSYIMHPYNLVKDHRTGYQTSDVQKVLDGEIDEFIEAYLRNRRK
jgi:peptide chain release factor 2